MPPVLATAAGLVRPQRQTLKHGTFLLEGIVVALAATEAVAEVLVVLVVGVWLLRVDAAFSVRLRIDAQGARARFWESRGAAIAGKVALIEDLDERVFTVALHGTGVADTGRIVGIRRARGRRVAGQTGEDTLTERAERLCAVLDALGKGLAGVGVSRGGGVARRARLRARRPRAASDRE